MNIVAGIISGLTYIIIYSYIKYVLGNTYIISKIGVHPIVPTGMILIYIWAVYYLLMYYDFAYMSYKIVIYEILGACIIGLVSFIILKIHQNIKRKNLLRSFRNNLPN